MIFFNLKLFYILFLLLFSYVILCDFKEIDYSEIKDTGDLPITIYEIILTVWVFTFLVDEIRQVKKNA
jgi:hypothetical protein